MKRLIPNHWAQRSACMKKSIGLGLVGHPKAALDDKRQMYVDIKEELALIARP